MPLHHFTLTFDRNYVHSAYLSTLFYGEDDGPRQHPGSYSVSCAESNVRFSLFHGRFDPAQEMQEWGFLGPEFLCRSVAHDPDVILLQDCDPDSLALAKHHGLTVKQDTILLVYEDDMVVVPDFEGRQAYFGDHSAYILP